MSAVAKDCARRGLPVAVKMPCLVAPGQWHRFVSTAPCSASASPISVGARVQPHSRVPTTARLQVFLSHSTEDRAHVALVRQQIDALGIDVYLAEHDPKPGTSIAQKIDVALRRSHAVVVLITTTSVSSAYVQQEVGLARAYGKPLVPIVETSVDKARLGILTELEWLELDLSRPADAMAKVIASLQPLVLAPVSSERVRESHTRRTRPHGRLRTRGSRLTARTADRFDRLRQRRGRRVLTHA